MDVSDPKLGTCVAGRYRLEERLGAGGMGVVYRGEDTRTQRTIALKFLHEALAGVTDLVKRFEREVDAMSRLDHPNLVGIIDSGVEAGVPYLVMEFHSGKPLAELVERGALPPARAVALTRQVLAGVAAAHASGVVHRDLKPDNIMLLDGVDGDFVKIFDFGLAKMVHGSTQATKLTNTGFALGTPTYMSPEQATGAPTDERADIYAIGVMLYHMVTGRVPFEADSPLTVLLKHADEAPVPPRKVSRKVRISDELEAAILRAMEKKPGDRWRSADAFAAALEAAPENAEGTIPDVDVSLQESIDSKTVLGRRAAAAAPSKPPGTSLLRRIPARWIVRVAAIAIVGVGGAMLWSKISRGVRREQQQVVKKVDEAVDSAKDIFHSLTKAIPSPAQAAPTSDAENDANGPGHQTPGAKLEAASRASSRRPNARPLRVQTAGRLLATGKTDDAIQLLYQLRRQNPRNAEVALLLGHAYSHKLWRSDALREYGEALKLQPALRNDRLLQRNAIAALDDPTFKAASAFIRARLGSAAALELRRTSRQSKNPRVQARAARLVLELTDGARSARR